MFMNNSYHYVCNRFIITMLPIDELLRACKRSYFFFIFGFIMTDTSQPDCYGILTKRKEMVGVLILAANMDIRSLVRRSAMRNILVIIYAKVTLQKLKKRDGDEYLCTSQQVRGIICGRCSCLINRWPGRKLNMEWLDKGPPAPSQSTSCN